MCSHLQKHQRTPKRPNANDVEVAEQSQDWTLDCTFIPVPVMKAKLICHQNTAPAVRQSCVFVQVCACRYISRMLLFSGMSADAYCWTITLTILLAATLWLSCPLKIIGSNGVFLQRRMPQIQWVPARALIPTNSLSNYYQCTDSNPRVCKSVIHNSTRHKADRMESGIQLFDNRDSRWQNKLMCNLPEKVSCIYCRVFDLLQTWELPSTCVVGCRTLFKGTLTEDVEE